MSHEAVSLVKSRSFGSVTRKAIALVLADYCDAAWSCFVGQERLAWESETSDRTARRTLADFERETLIERQHRYDDGGRRTSDRILLRRERIELLPVRMAGGLPAKDAALAATSDATTGHSLAGESLDGEPSEMNLFPVDAWFDEWWQIYPKKSGKLAAKKAFAKVVGRVVPFAALISGAARYRDDPNRDPKFTKDPATWLNAGCWDDEPLPARNGNGRSSNRAPIIGDEARTKTPTAEVVRW